MSYSIQQQSIRERLMPSAGIVQPNDAVYAIAAKYGRTVRAKFGVGFMHRRVVGDANPYVGTEFLLPAGPAHAATSGCLMAALSRSSFILYNASRR